MLDGKHCAAFMFEYGKNGDLGSCSMMEHTSPNSLLHILMNVGGQFSRRMNLAVAQAWLVRFALDGGHAREDLHADHCAAIVFFANPPTQFQD